MGIELTPEHEKIVRRKMKAGGYRSESAVIGEALKALEEREKRKPAKPGKRPAARPSSKEERLAEFKRLAQEGDEDLARGRYKDYDAAGLRALAAEIGKKGRSALAAKRSRARAK